MALNKTYWDYDNANSDDWSGYGIKYADKQIYANPNFSWGNLDLSFPTSFRKGKVTKIYTVTSSTAQDAVTVDECIIYNSMVRFSGSGNYGSFYKDNILSYYSAGNEGYFPVIDIDTHEFAYKMTVRLFTSGNWVTVNAVDFVNNYDNYDAGVYGYINNYMTAGGGRSYGFCNFYDCGNSQFSVKANWNGFRTSGYSSREMGGHVTSGQTWISNRTIWQLATTSGMASYSTQPATYNMYIPFEIPELQGQSWNAGNYQSAPAALITGGSYTNHVVLSYSDQRVYMPLKHILRDIVVNCGLVLLDSNDDKWISMVDSNGLCQNKLVLMSSDEAKESSIYNTRTSDNNLNPNPPEPPTEDAEAETFGWGGNEVGGMVHYYLLSQVEMESLASFMSDPNWTIDYRNCIVSMFIIPNNGALIFDEDTYEPTTVKFKLDDNHKVDTHVNCSRIHNVVNNVGTIEIPRMNGNFLDYEPYTKYYVYVPFCGVISLPDYVAGKEIKVTIYPDVPTCSCTAIVSSEDRKIATLRGNFGSSIPVTSDGSGLKTAAVINSVANGLVGIGEMAAGAALDNAGLVIGGGATAISSIMQTAVTFGQSFGYSVGSSGDTSFFGVGSRSEYYIAYPEWNNPDNVDSNIYGHTYGFVVNKRGIIGDFEGFTICDNPHVTGFSCTSEEKDEIERLLREGIIIHNPSE